MGGLYILLGAVFVAGLVTYFFARTPAQGLGCLGGPVALLMLSILRLSEMTGERQGCGLGAGIVGICAALSGAACVGVLLAMGMRALTRKGEAHPGVGLSPSSEAEV